MMNAHTHTNTSGDMHMITLTDMFGFECFHRNRTEQLMINSLNEQIQYHYNQRMFVWEMMEQVIYDHMRTYITAIVGSD